MPEQTIRILAIDVGAGTQDILVFESDRTPENCVKLVMPSQTQVVGTRIRRATRRGDKALNGLRRGGDDRQPVGPALIVGVLVGLGYQFRDAARLKAHARRRYALMLL